MKHSRPYCPAGSWLILTVLAALIFPGSALATWSIVAVDAETKEVGSAGASCTGFVAGIVGVAPGHGVIVAQARSNGQAREEGVRLLLDGASPKSIVTAVANIEFDPHFQEQQYGVAALGFESSAAGFTGTDTHPWQGHATPNGVAVQGNILTGPEVIKATLDAFEANHSLPLAERLLVALEAGDAAGGDKRCGEQSALSSYLVVARPGETKDSYSVKIIVPGQKPGGSNPVEILRQRFDGRPEK
jgi:uncharacterized Ntn-hydrolase superfamily protein